MSLKIYAVGDIMLGEQQLCNNFGVKSIIQKNGPDFPFREISPLFKDGDIVFGNLECSISKISSKSDKKPLFFCAEPDVTQGLKNAHFNALSVANNHVMENGEKTYLHTIEALKDNAIVPVGIKDKIEFLNTKGYRIAFLGYSFIQDHIADACYNKIESEDTIIKDIEKAKGISDLIIVSLHWGCEYVPYPSPDQIQIGRDLVDAGADIILGGHSHVTQSYEIYKNRPIFYSLGNFIFDHTYIPATRRSFIAEITVHGSRDSIDVNIIPVDIDASDYHPRPVNTPKSDTFLKFVDSIRDTFENQSVSSYCTFIGNYEYLYNQYKKPVKWDEKSQFVKNFHRYSLSTTLDLIKQYLGKQIGSRT